MTIKYNQVRITYEEAKEKERIITDYYWKKFQEVDKGAKRLEDKRYNFGDLAVKDSRGKLHVLEVKYRHYDLEYFKNNGVFVDKMKLDNIKKEYGVESFTLITITSDNEVIKTKINNSCECRKFNAPRKSYVITQYVEKEMLISYFYQWDSITPFWEHNRSRTHSDFMRMLYEGTKELYEKQGKLDEFYKITEKLKSEGVEFYC